MSTSKFQPVVRRSFEKKEEPLATVVDQPIIFDDDKIDRGSSVNSHKSHKSHKTT